MYHGSDNRYVYYFTAIAHTYKLTLKHLRQWCKYEYNQKKDRYWTLKYEIDRDGHLGNLHCKLFHVGVPLITVGKLQLY